MNDQLSHTCKWCNQPSTIIWVHGHGQCSVCGINVDECCRGEEAQLLSSPAKILNENCNAKIISQPGKEKNADE
jgi:hypothetical protein